MQKTEKCKCSLQVICIDAGVALKAKLYRNVTGIFMKKSIEFTKLGLTSQILWGLNIFPGKYVLFVLNGVVFFLYLYIVCSVTNPPLHHGPSAC